MILVSSVIRLYYQSQAPHLSCGMKIFCTACTIQTKNNLSGCIWWHSNKEYPLTCLKSFWMDGHVMNFHFPGIIYRPQYKRSELNKKLRCSTPVTFFHLVSHYILYRRVTSHAMSTVAMCPVITRTWLLWEELLFRVSPLLALRSSCNWLSYHFRFHINEYRPRIISAGRLIPRSINFFKIPDIKDNTTGWK